MTFDVDFWVELEGQGHTSKFTVTGWRSFVGCSAVDACYVVTCVHSESPEGSTKRAHKIYTIYWLFVESFMLKWSVRGMSFWFLTVNAKASVA